MINSKKPGQVVLWRQGIASFRWLLLEVKGTTPCFQIKCETLILPSLIYAPDTKYAVGKETVWDPQTEVVELSEMEVIAWASSQS